MCITPLYTSKVCNLFFGGIFSHTYLLKGVHFGTWAVFSSMTVKSVSELEIFCTLSKSFVRNYSRFSEGSKYIIPESKTVCTKQMSNSLLLALSTQLAYTYRNPIRS